MLVRPFGVVMRMCCWRWRMARCLSLGDPTVTPEPHPTYLGGQSWQCRRCHRVFSEQTPTFYPAGECKQALDDDREVTNG